MRRLLLVSAFVFGCSSAPKAAPPATAPVLPTTIEEAVASTTYRSADNRARDVYRHPVETLTFFGVQPSMTVVEVAPGGGWYQEILAPLIVTQGHYVAAASPYAGEGVPATVAWQKAHPEVAAKITAVDLKEPLVPAGTADRVLTFRNVHNWMANGTAQANFNAFFAALKPGGILGVEEHRANPKSKKDPKAKSGYVREADVIALARKAGFKLDAKSEINANPKDTKNYAEGVWTLPPVLRLKDKDRERYQAIGESDRMTLRFVKP